MERGYVKLWRKTLDSGLLEHPTAWQLFGYLLLKASHKPHKQIINGKVFELHAGELVFSRAEAAVKLKLGEQQIRTALFLLKKLEIVTSKPTNKGTLISFVNWDRYNGDQPALNQQVDQQTNQQLTSTQPAPNQQTTSQQVKINKNGRIKNIKIQESIKACTESSGDASMPEPVPPPASAGILLPEIQETTKPDPCVMELPVTGDREQPMHKVFASDAANWQELYPGVDVMQQLRNMRGWLDSNPQRRKTKTGIKKFITGWLAKEQNHCGGARASPPVANQHKTYAELEEDNFQRLLEKAKAEDAARAAKGMIA